MSKLKNIKNTYLKGREFFESTYHNQTLALNRKETQKGTSRTEILNFLIDNFNRDTTYLEIGVRNPNDNFSSIKATTKYGVDPGVEFEENPVEFKMTSDAFFEQLSTGKVLTKETRFDLVFIDGLHLAEQVDRDISNALNYIKDDGFVVLHDCNPPSEWHARETYEYYLSPAQGYWNGTTWKAFLKARQNKNIQSCCIDSDWGVGILSKTQPLGNATEIENPFFEYKKMANDREKVLNLISFSKLQEKSKNFTFIK